MGWKGQALLAASGAMSIIGGCVQTSAFACHDGSDCGIEGICEPQGACSFADTTCSSGRRFGSHSGTLSEKCVPPPDPDPTTGAGQTTRSDGGDIGSGLEEDGETGTPVGSSGDISTSATAQTGDGSDEADASTTDDGTGRVQGGLLALYTFDGNADDRTVEDASGLGPLIPLTLIGENFEWRDTGLFTAGTNAIIQGEGTAAKIRDGCQATDELTAEAWVSPGSAEQFGFMRILTFSAHVGSRNFTMGQGADDQEGFAARLRTSTGGYNGFPQVNVVTPVALEPTHIVFTHAADGTEFLYIDGTPIAQPARAGTFENWAQDTNSYKFALGNELSFDRPWTGEFHLVAIYDRALSAQEVTRNFDEGF